MLAVKLADVGIGAVLGAIISGAVLLLLDQRRRSWERKTRFLAERRLSYNTFLRYLDLLRDDMQLIADFVLLLRDEKLGGAMKHSPEARKQATLLADRVSANAVSYREHLLAATTELTLLWPASAIRAAHGMTEALMKMSKNLRNPYEVLDRLDKVELNDLSVHSRDYDSARDEFVAEVRSDLSIRT